MIRFFFLLNQWYQGGLRRFRNLYIRSILGECGSQVQIDRGVTLLNPYHIYLGCNASLNQGVLLQATKHSSIKAGNNVIFSYRATILTAERKIEDYKISSDHQYADVVIGNNVWICANATILPRTVIDDNVVVAAGAVAKGHLESGWIYAGIPAKPKKRLND